jgi:iron complex transport system substrate-binding protein
MTRLVIFIFLSFFSYSSLGADKPLRVASMSLCSDELLLLLADRSHIISLSYLSTDPRYSSFITDNNIDLSGIYLNRGQAEEIIPLEPDLVLSSRFSASNAINLLQSFGYSITTLEFPATLDQTFQQIEEVAMLLDEQERGEDLIQQFRNSINTTRDAFDSGRNISAIFYANNGFSYGANTLHDNFLSSLGINNLASAHGLVGSGKIPLELLVSTQPDFLIIDQASLHDEKLAQPLLHHPVLKQYFPAEKIIVLPSTLFQCAGPSLIQAYEIMAQILGGGND